jgi:hypothetical protein
VFRVPVFRCSGVPGFTNSQHFRPWSRNFENGCNVKNQETPKNMANLFRFSNNEKYDLRNNGINF